MAIQVKKGFVLRKIGPQYMAVPFGTMTNQIKGMISLTESGYVLWQALEKGVPNQDALVDLLLSQYDVEREDAAHDVEDFLNYLQSIGVLEV